MTDESNEAAHFAAECSLAALVIPRGNDGNAGVSCGSYAPIGRDRARGILSAIRANKIPGVYTIAPPSKCDIDEPCRICGEHHHPAISAGWHKETIANLRALVDERAGRWIKCIAPCPWCGDQNGSHVEVVDATEMRGTWRLVHRCVVVGYLSIDRVTRDEVVAAWNARTRPPQPDLSKVREALEEKVVRSAACRIRQMYYFGPDPLIAEENIAAVVRESLSILAAHGEWKQ